MFNHLLFIPSRSLTQLIFCTAAARRIPADMGDLLGPWDAPEGPKCPSQAEWKVQGLVDWFWYLRVKEISDIPHRLYPAPF